MIQSDGKSKLMKKWLLSKIKYIHLKKSNQLINMGMNIEQIIDWILKNGDKYPGKHNAST